MNNNKETHHIFSHYHDDHQETNKNCSHPDCFIDQVRNPDGTLKLRNPHLQDVKSDFLYHLGFGMEDLREKFGDVKVSSFVGRLIFS